MSAVSHMFSPGLFILTDLLMHIAVTEEAFLIHMSSFFTRHRVFQDFGLINLGSFDMMPIRTALIIHLQLLSSVPGHM